MKIRLKSDHGIAPSGVYEALEDIDGYFIMVDHRVKYISKYFAEEVDEFEEMFMEMCDQKDNGDIEYIGGFLSSIENWVMRNDVALLHKEEIPSLVLALLKLMDE